MALVVLGPYLPGFTEGSRQPKIERHLAERSIYDDEDGGEMIAYAFNRMVAHLPGMKLQSFSDTTIDPRDRILAMSLRKDCMSLIWWHVSREGDGHRWQVYAGLWNDETAFLALNRPSGRSLLWLSSAVDSSREILDLESL